MDRRISEGNQRPGGYDPDLKEAMAEIEKICKRFACGGHIVLVSPTHVEFRFSLPEWSALREELDPTGAAIVRLKVNKAEMGEELSKRKAELTAHFLCELKDESARLFGFADGMLEMTKEAWKIEHTIQKVRPHRPEEN